LAELLRQTAGELCQLAEPFCQTAEKLYQLAEIFCHAVELPECAVKPQKVPKRSKSASQAAGCIKIASYPSPPTSGQPVVNYGHRLLWLGAGQ
jgi:hypothetical protein